MALTPAQRHKDRVASVGCVVCRRLGHGNVPAQLHHIAGGSSKRSPFALVGLCPEHHDAQRSGSGFHGMGTRTFCSIFSVPWLREEGLLVWVNEDLSRYAK
ncbi:MAG TPA: Ref family recombination enhancement nuclease [bacterium]|nr:Ref family recombination enhancement nuclease [bacterium]